MQGIYTQQNDGRASSVVQVVLLGNMPSGASRFAAASGDKVDIVHMMNKHGAGQHYIYIYIYMFANTYVYMRMYTCDTLCC